MTMQPEAVVSPARRFAAILALLTWVALVVFLLVAAVSRWFVLLATVTSISVFVLAAWYVLARHGAARVVGAVIAVVAMVAFVVVMVTSESIVVLLVALVLASASVGAAGYALRTGGSDELAHSPAPAQHPVLLINPRSGGGKAERFGLTDLCLQAGVEPVMLLPGDDLLQLAESVVAAGADLIGMAGGDGSQALVASVASRHGLPFVVVPAGTRNHFALDLGIDREDVPGSLDAFRDGVDRLIDLAEVNGRVFVNNAAMGVYATVVQSADYRDAKIQTMASMLPDLIGPTAQPSELHCTLPSGEDLVAGQLLLISNNPYQLRHLRGGGRRSRLDAGVLGAASVTVSTAADVEALTALELTGRVDQFHGWREWTAPTIEIRSTRPVEVGVDGEALVLEPPLRFAIRPAALTIRVPRAAATDVSGGQPTRLTDRSTITALFQLAFGHRKDT
ncbi:MAG TPA: diacylglycerol kinase family protein [Microlunatus sp.]|nr:diacylglycerol kinase family protein [Microlunatus sp.]